MKAYKEMKFSSSSSSLNERYDNHRWEASVGQNDNDIRSSSSSSSSGGDTDRRIIRMEMHPILPPYIRVLMQQQSPPPYDEKDDNQHHLHDHHHRQLLLEDAITSLKGVGAAYMSLMEFTTTTTPLFSTSPNLFISTTTNNSNSTVRKLNHFDDGHPNIIENQNLNSSSGSRRSSSSSVRENNRQYHLQQFLEQVNNEHNEALREYNKHYRRYSRYQWALILREEEQNVERSSGGPRHHHHHHHHHHYYLRHRQLQQHNNHDKIGNDNNRHRHNDTFVKKLLDRRLKNSNSSSSSSSNNKNKNTNISNNRPIKQKPPPSPPRVGGGRGKRGKGGNNNYNSNNINNVGMTKKKGGIFNSYQTSPLQQGYGTHYATIWVGTPPQRQSVIVDTGSHFTAFPCKGCVNCGEELHTDKYFDPDASSTFRALTCNECLSGRCSSSSSSSSSSGGGGGLSVNDEDGKCLFSQAYTEGSSWSAYESMDKVFMGATQLLDIGNDNNNNPTSNNHFRGDFMFGCQTQESGLFVTQLADGIMGMSNHPMTYPQVMYDQGMLEHNMFSLCFRRELHVSKRGIVAGMITLGGIDTRADHAPMVYAKNVATSGWFTVFVKSVYIRHNGGQHAKADVGLDQKVQELDDVDLYEMNSGKGVIIDSGTTDTYLHVSIAKQFELAWEIATEGRWKFSNDRSIALDGEELLRLPTILIEMAAYGEFALPNEKKTGLAGESGDPNLPQDVILAIPASHYMEYAAPIGGARLVGQGKGTYTPRIYFTETQGSVIGANAMQAHNVLFDRENGRVGFAESSCEYHEQSDAISGEGGVMSVDCILGAPSLSISCSESADLSRCKRIGTNPDTTIDGLEIWSRIVQAPGMSQGLTCEEVSIKQNEMNGGEDMEVNCDGKGVCREVRKCIISCANAIAHGAAAANAALSPIGSCGAVTWSACDYSCTQTKLNSILMSDGKCHEDKSMQATRPCHVQSCGRSDPCRVPFVVHSIIKIRGAVASHWTKHAEEVFVEAFAAAINGQKAKDQVFGPGDVVVLSASPWRAKDDSIVDTSSEEGESEELGMQLVVEISIFNYNAEIPPSTSGKGVPLAICHERDLQPLANVALNVHKTLAQSDFVKIVVEMMKSDESIGEVQMSPFYHTFQEIQLAQESQVVTSWTIKTDVGTEYSNVLVAFGDLLSIDFFAMFTLLCSITAYVCRQQFTNRKKITGERGGQSTHELRPGKVTRSNAHRVRWANDDDDTIRAVADRNYKYDARTALTDDNSEYTASTANESIGESYRSVGSLSTYLEKTSRRARELSS